MAKGFKQGGGSLPLNFKVIGNPQPETAKENTIWVDTDKINNYYFSATQPENMVDYDVWFPVGTSSTVAFSATKKNPVMVYPISAKQMVSGALVYKAAKSCQGGEWVDWWDGYLYNSGDEHIDITGGFLLAKAASGQASKSATSISLGSVTGGDHATRYANCYTDKPISLSGRKTLTLIYDSSQNGSTSYAVKVCIAKEKTLFSTCNSSNYESVLGSSSTTTGSNLELKYDISNIGDGDYFVGVYTRSNNINVHKLRVE